MTRVDPINRALVFIEGQLAENLGVDEIARASRISRYHLSRVFAEATGYPPWRYVMLRRLPTQRPGYVAVRPLRCVRRGLGRRYGRPRLTPAIGRGRSPSSCT